MAPGPETDQPRFWPSFWRTVARFDSDKIVPLLALRNTVGVVTPLIVAIAIGRAGDGLIAATGALNVSFSDNYDPYRKRARRMFAASFMVCAAVLFGTVLGHSQVALVFSAVLAAFATGMMVALGSAAADIGTVTLVTFVVFLAQPRSFEAAILAGLLALGGALFQTLLSLLFWAVRRYEPERRILAAYFQELGRASGTPVQTGEAMSGSFDTDTHQAVAMLSRDHSIEAERYVLLFAQAERIRLSLLVLGNVYARLKKDQHACRECELLDNILASCSAILSVAGNMLMADKPVASQSDQMAAWRSAVSDFHALPSDSPAAGTETRFYLDALDGQVRAVADLTAHIVPTDQGEYAAREAIQPWRLRFTGALAILRANLTMQSAACRHAIRLAFCILVGELLGRYLGIRRSYWMPMTIAIVLKPDFTSTFSRGVLRLAGTFFGLLLATIFSHIVPPSPGRDVCFIGFFYFLLRCFGPANYGVFVAAVSSLVVFLFAIPGIPAAEVISARGENTAVGGAIALLVYWLWPTWERTQVAEALAQMLDAYRDYIRTVKAAYWNPSSVNTAEMNRLRSAARLARSNLEASVDRISGEPGTEQGQLARLGSILASSHRLAYAVLALEAGLYRHQAAAPREAFQVFANQVELTLYYLSTALRGGTLEPEYLPDLRRQHSILVTSHADGLYGMVKIETDRITNSLNTLSGGVLQWIRETAGAR